jgi:hypothetical protein
LEKEQPAIAPTPKGKTKMKTTIQMQPLPESPNEPFANRHGLTLDYSQPYWVYVRFIDSIEVLFVIRTWELDGLGQVGFEEKVLEKLANYEPVAIEIPDNSRPRSVVTGRYLREDK